MKKNAKLELAVNAQVVELANGSTALGVQGKDGRILLVGMSFNDAEELVRLIAEACTRYGGSVQDGGEVEETFESEEVFND